MHPVLQLLLFWLLAFVSLGLAVALVNVYSNVIGSDLTLHSAGKEAAVAGIASLVEAASVWAVLSYIPSAARALILPALLVGLIYKISHFQDWSTSDVVLLLVAQTVIGCSGVALFFGHFQLALIRVGVFGACLAIMAAFIRNL